MIKYYYIKCRKIDAHNYGRLEIRGGGVIEKRPNISNVKM